MVRARSSNLWAGITILFVALVGSVTAWGKVVYVDANAPGADDGTSWENAYNFLQDALADANSSEKPIEIRVAQGVYTPDSNSTVPEGTRDRKATFQLMSYVTLKGGYAGYGQAYPDARDAHLYKTILSGDLDANDFDASDISHGHTLTHVSRMENSYHIITVGQSDEPIVLDGITVECGHALVQRVGRYGTPVEEGIEEDGAGIYCIGGVLDCLNCTFQKNLTIGYGGAIFCDGGRATLTHCRIVENAGGDSGGAIASFGGHIILEEDLFADNEAGYQAGGLYANQCNITATDCQFSSHFAYWGGAIRATGSMNATFVRCSFTENMAARSGGVFFTGCVKSLVLLDCQFLSNVASAGGAMYNNCVPDVASQLTLVRSYFAKNFASSYGGGVINNHITSHITDCIFEENTALGSGGGMSCAGSTTLTRCIFEKNRSGGYGGGIRVTGVVASQSDARLTDCVFVQNRASSGGGMRGDSYDIILTHCGFYGNEALDEGGGATFAQVTQAELHNCTFAGNRAPYGNALSRHYRDWGSRDKNIEIFGSILCNGEDEIGTDACHRVLAAYSNLTGGWPGEGNIDVDPCFASSGYWDPNGTPTDANDDFFIHGDYHLKSQAGRYDPTTQTWAYDDITSPCIDAGDPMSPIGAEPFPNGGIINMGAYGATEEASKSYFGKPPCETIVAGDINGDCEVNFLDFQLMALHWCEDNNP